ncbi:MAG: hypothetical protein KDB69_04930, partial [Acidimicrobiia bacterium]|nr:hypothetical protein [Acidimicrobiia bacterium]
MASNDRALREAEQLLTSGDWHGALTALDATDDPDDPRVLAGVGAAQWWLGDLTGSIRARERAFVQFQRSREPERAVEIALRLGFDYQSHASNNAAAEGWVHRAERIGEVLGDDGLTGWIRLARSDLEGSVANRISDAREALRIARQVNDPDLELCALSALGHLLVSNGAISEGIALLDDAMAGTAAEEWTSPETVVFTSCNMLVAAVEAVDFARAVGCVAAASDFAERYRAPFLSSQCRVVYGRVLFLTGDWAGAEEELAFASSTDIPPTFRGQAAATLAELHLARGDVGAAKATIAAVPHGLWSGPPLVRLRLVEGNSAAAAATAIDHLRTDQTPMLTRCHVLEVLGESWISLGDHEAAEATARDLGRLASSVDRDLPTARWHRLEGRLMLATDRATDAHNHLSLAIDGFDRLHLRYEVAKSQAMLAEALSST